MPVKRKFDFRRLFKKWDDNEFVRALIGGWLSGVVCGTIYESFVPGPGVLVAAALGGLIGLVGAAITFAVDKI